MKKLLRKIKAKATLKTYQKPLFVTILILLAINLLVLIVAAIVAYNMDPAYFDYNPVQAFAHTVTWMVSANSINNLLTEYKAGDLTELNIIVVAAIVIAVGMILFSGAIIATLTTALKSFIDKKSKASGKIDIDNHFVIINWNSKVPEMIYNLMTKNYRNNIVILSDQKKEYITTQIQSLISAKGTKYKRKANLIIKKANPLLHGELENISIKNASSIVIMAREDMERGDDINISNSDLNSLKILLALGNFDINKDCNIVIETEFEATKSKIENLSRAVKTLSNKSIIPISFNHKIGQIIAQTIIDPELSDIYLDLLSFDGCEFYSYDEEEVYDYLKSHNNGIPIIKFNKLFVLAEDEKALADKRGKAIDVARALEVRSLPSDEKFTCFVIGDNQKRDAIIENLSLAKIGYNAQFGVNVYHKDDTKSLIADIKKTEGNKKILILSDDTVSEDSYDANVFVTLIALAEAFPSKENLSFITEILDSRNLNTVRDFNIRNAIISNSMVSLLLTQLALNKDSKKFYEGLLTTDTEEGGDFFDIQISKLSEVLDPNQDLTFDTKASLIHSFYLSFERKLMILGYIRDGKEIFLADNQDERNPITLLPTDKIIYIKY